MAQPWLEVDIDGLRQTLERKGKAFAIFELVQNAWDEAATQVSVSLSEPKAGVSVLRCVDDSPEGYRDLSTTHTMFAKSYKKEDPTKRGRFNVGEKLVLALCDRARVTSTSGTVIFATDRTRRTSAKKTKAGTEFVGELQMTPDEYKAATAQVMKLIPPIPTLFNDELIPERKPLKVFQAKLQTEIADDRNVLRVRQRATEVRLYKVRSCETAMLYEKGIPVVELDEHLSWHVDVQQKIPLNIDRDNVSPSYAKAIYVTVLNEMHNYVATEKEATAPWARAAMEDKRIREDAVKAIVKARFGDKVAAYDPSSIGSNRECTAQNITVVHGGAMSKEEWKNVKKADAIQAAGKVCPVDKPLSLNAHVPPEDYGTSLQRFVKLINDVSPLLLPSHAVTVKVINDNNDEIRGCTQWREKTYIFTINIAYQNTENWPSNYHLLIHEIAHHKVQRNDHLFEGFYRAVTDIGAALSQVALARPELFDGIPLPEAMRQAEEAA